MQEKKKAIKEVNEAGRAAYWKVCKVCKNDFIFYLDPKTEICHICRGYDVPKRKKRKVLEQ